jgi:apolipoprotein N-acyltransferase
VVLSDACIKRRSGTGGAAKEAAIAIAVSLVLSAYLTSLSMAGPSASWLAWISLVPLFWTIKFLRPRHALHGGMLWGVSLYLFAAAGGVIPRGALSLTLLICLPAAYAGIGSLVTRRVGFSALTLALGWVLVEFALRPIGLEQGFLARTQADSALLNGVADALGYVFVAFIVVGANAWLLEFMADTRFVVPRLCTVLDRACAESHLVAASMGWPVGDSHVLLARPRAPPEVTEVTSFCSPGERVFTSRFRLSGDLVGRISQCVVTELL